VAPDAAMIVVFLVAEGEAAISAVSIQLNQPT
jgi:hypothetical protein